VTLILELDGVTVVSPGPGLDKAPTHNENLLVKKLEEDVRAVGKKRPGQAKLGRDWKDLRIKQNLISLRKEKERCTTVLYAKPAP
jgi:hypothetical protein